MKQPVPGLAARPQRGFHLGKERENVRSGKNVEGRCDPLGHVIYQPLLGKGKGQKEKRGNKGEKVRSREACLRQVWVGGVKKNTNRVG